MSKSKAKGTRAESAVVKFLQSHGIEAERKALSGSLDRGDVKVVTPEIWGDTNIALEVKAGKQTANFNRSQFENWWMQAMVEADNCGDDPALCIVRYNRSLKDADVYVLHHGMIAHMYLDQFVDYIGKEV